MNNWIKAEMDTAFYDETEAWINEECEILFLPTGIKVRYEDADDEITWTGNEISQGHYELRCPELDGKASLHCFPKSRILEGYWHEEGARGFWKITLSRNEPRA